MIYVGVRVKGDLEKELLKRAATGRSRAEIVRGALASYFGLDEGVELDAENKQG